MHPIWLGIVNPSLKIMFIYIFTRKMPLMVNIKHFLPIYHTWEIYSSVLTLIVELTYPVADIGGGGGGGGGRPATPPEPTISESL